MADERVRTFTGELSFLSATTTGGTPVDADELATPLADSETCCF